MISLDQIVQRVVQFITFKDDSRSPKTQYRINLLSVIILSDIVGICLLMIYGLLSDGTTRFALTILNSILLGLNIWALQRTLKGHVQLTARLIIGIWWVSIALATYGSNGLYSSAIMGMMAILVTGILLLDRRAVAVLFIGTLTYFFTLLHIELSGNLPDAPFKDLPFRITLLTITATSLLLVAGYHRYAIQTAERKAASLHTIAERQNVQNRLTQDIVHDLRTPVSVLKTTAYLIKRRQEKGLPIDDTVAKLERQTDHLNAMIEDLFELTLLDYVNNNITFTFVNLPDLLSKRVAYMQMYAEARAIKIKLKSEATDEATILGDQKQLVRAFNNLIENAIHYGKHGGYIDIAVHYEDDCVVVSIKDDGIGIAPENYDLIFERFYRVEDSRTTRDRQGTGIGLSTVKEIIQLHGGHIELDSRLGHGSTFKVILPIKPKLAVPASKPLYKQITAVFNKAKWALHTQK